jgi:hypothetical protein
MAYVQYLNAYGEWKATERMTLERAEIEAASMHPSQEAFVRACN